MSQTSNGTDAAKWNDIADGLQVAGSILANFDNASTDSWLRPVYNALRQLQIGVEDVANGKEPPPPVPPALPPLPLPGQKVPNVNAIIGILQAFADAAINTLGTSTNPKAQEITVLLTTLINALAAVPSSDSQTTS